MPSKPIRVFYSELGQRFYATSHYKQVGEKTVLITGRKFDVTDEIAAAVLKYKIKFSAKKAKVARGARE